jgi:AraC-like DNA-binding protein
VGESFSTLEVAPNEGVDFWRDMVRRHFVPLQIEPLCDAEFNGTVALRSVGELDTARVRAPSMLATRTRRHIERSGGDEYFIALHLRGLAHGEQDARHAVLRPGDFALFDSTRPYRIAFRAAESFDHLILRIPREQLDLRVPHLDQATALTVKAGSAAGRIAGPALKTLALDGEAAFVEPMLDLLAAAVTEAAGLARPGPSRRRRTINDIKRYTLARLADPELSPARVAKGCFLSPRQLHRLFAQEGTTFGAFVKEARLRRIHRDLADPGLADATIADIGRRHGIRHPAVLTRVFTERYGSGPRAFRTAQANGPATRGPGRG